MEVILLLIIVIILFLTLNNTNNNTINNSNTTPSNNNLTYNNILHLALKEGKETQSVFSDTFLTNTSLVVNALDNIEARLYVDKRCITNKIPLFESGTLGTKGNVQVVIPYKTERYSSSRDPPDKSIPLCTIRNFPHCIEHTIEWALSEFQSNFEEKIIGISEYIKGDNYKDSKLEGDNDSSSNYRGVDYGIDVEQDPINESTNTLHPVNDSTSKQHPLNNSTTKQHPLNTIPTNNNPHTTIPTHDNRSTESDTIGEDIRVLVRSIPKNIYEGVREGVILFNKYFYINIKTLIETFPVGHVTGEGQPFWVPPKRPHVPFIFNKFDCLHVLFVQSYCRVISSVYGIKGFEREGEGNGEGVSYQEVEDIIREGMYDKSMLEGVNDKDTNVKGVNDRGTNIKGVNHKGNNIKGVNYSSNGQQCVSNSLNKQHPLNNSSNEQHPFNHTPNTLHTNTPSTNNTDNIITLHPVTLEKDNDSNGHIDFIYACANLRARNYKIKEVSKLTVKGIAGRIIPAIATTTSVISGLCVLEMIRYVLYGNGYKNWYVNLGLSFIGCTDVIEAEKMECGMVRCDSNGFEGVSNRDRLEGVNYSTNTLHPINTNTTTFTLWNSFVFGDCKL
ncbi:ubiquitin-activating enzyme, partial [Hamiltosporidium magnivora]